MVTQRIYLENGKEISEEEFNNKCKLHTITVGYPFQLNDFYLGEFNQNNKENWYLAIDRILLTLDEKKVLSSYNEITSKFYKALQMSKQQHKSLILADISHKQIMLGQLVSIKISLNIDE